MKKAGLYAGIILLFVGLSYGFVPEVLGGKVVNQSDISGWRGMAEETLQWNAAHPEDKALWSDSMFGGMPTVTVLDDFEGDWTKPLYKALLWGTRPASYLFIALLGAFLMMLAMGVSPLLAVAGAIAVAFCSYNFQIIQVGHNTKMQAIAFAPWVLAAMIFTFRRAFAKASSWKEWIPMTTLGAVLFGLALSMQIKANHVQITYYLAIVIFIYAVATVIWLCQRENRALWPRFAAAAALLLVVGLAGIGTNANKLIPTAKYAPFTMRGGSELSRDGANDKGLSLDYATAWSYGIDETPNLMIPNYNGGSSNGSLGKNSQTWQLFQRAGQNPARVCANLPLYWGPQPFTAGPMYMGAICIFLFILGLLLCPGRDKWWLLVSCVLAIMLAWGNHMMWFTRLWFEYVPMYSKFRTVSMALVVLQFCMPLLGIYTLDRIVRGEYQGRRVVKAVWISFGITAGFCALAALVPAIAGDFVAPADAGMQDVVASALQADRRHLLQVDAWRSFLMITVVAAALVWSFYKPQESTASKRRIIVAALTGALILIDLWSVGKRYLNNDDFVTARDFSANFAERPVDRAILEDKSLSYRVLDLSESTFNSSRTSFRHKSIGGYSPTKMQRYQDLIDNYLGGEMNAFYRAVANAETIEDMEEMMPAMPVTSMLNGKYIIIGGEYPPVENRNAMGNAWFVNSCVKATGADEEIALLGSIDPAVTAVLREDRCPANLPDDLANPADEAAAADIPESAVITLDYYSPNELRYSYSCPEDMLTVFSEIYHPSWKASIDGVALDLFPADWVLRAAVLPAGSGELIMRYDPVEYTTGSNISRACSILLLLLLCVSAGFAAVAARKDLN